MAEWICVGYTTVWSGIYECSIPYLTAGVGVSYDPLSKGRIFCFFNGFLDIVVFLSINMRLNHTVIISLL